MAIDSIPKNPFRNNGANLTAQEIIDSETQLQADNKSAAKNLGTAPGDGDRGYDPGLVSTLTDRLQAERAMFSDHYSDEAIKDALKKDMMGALSREQKNAGVPSAIDQLLDNYANPSDAPKSRG